MKNENDYIICEICKEKVNRIYGAHLKRHKMTSKEYKEKYPNSPLTCKTDFKNTSKNSGLHMKEEKYKKIFAEKIKGEKNPNHKSKTTEKERKERSPFSVEFYLKKNIPENDIENLLENFKKEAIKDRSYTTNIDYYLNKGYSQEESEKMLHERQSTFSKEKCIERFGKEMGLEIWRERQRKWQESLVSGGNLKCGFSKISQELFYSLLEYYKVEDRIDVYFATKNKEYFISLKGGIFYQYDFVDLKNKKIIEYNGDEYHGNPNKFESTDHPHPFRKQITAKEMWKKDNDKVKIANEQGFDVLTIWNSEYKKEKELILEKCLEFLKIK
jgi:hypothetical protein